jgi:hypothetical protein
MPTDLALPPVRIRVRNRASDDTGRLEQRLIAEPPDPERRRREPNAGSMKKGETRNPNGRPRGAKGIKLIARQVLLTKMVVREGGKTRKLSYYQALLMKEGQLAAEGDWRARRTMLELGKWALADEAPSQPGEATASETTAADEAIIKWFEEEARASGKGGDS